MTTNTNKKMTWKRIAIAFTAVVAVFIAFLYFFVTPKLVSTLEETVYQETGGAYTLKVEFATINPSEFSIVLENIHLKPNPANFDSVSPFNSVIYAKIKQLDLGLTNIARLLSSKEVTIERLTLKQPELVYFIYDHATDEEAEINFDSTLTEASELGSLKIEELLLTDGQIGVYRVGQDTQRIAFSDHILFELADFEFNASLKNFVAFSGFRLTLDELNVVDHDQMLQFTANKAILNAQDSSFVARDIEMVSTVEPSQFARKKGFQTMVPTAEIGEVRIDGLSYLNIALKQFAEARKIAIDSVDLHLFKDQRNNFIGQKERVLPNTFIRGIEKRVRIDSVEISHMSVQIEEHTESGKKAKIRFENINGFVTNICNDSAHITKYPKMFFDVVGSIAGESEVSLRGFFELNHPNDAFEVKGTIDKMPLVVLNEFVDPITEVRFTKGKLEQMEFKMLADNLYARGKLKMNINAVSIQIGQKRTLETKRERIMRTIAISAGNTALQIHQKVTDPTKRKGNISYFRDPNKSVFAYIFRSSLSGMLSAMGVKNKEDRLQRPHPYGLNPIF